jgi:hypothetical protein
MQNFLLHPHANNNRNHRFMPILNVWHDQVHPIFNARKTCDIRLIILRHAERLDRLIGHDWCRNSFGTSASVAPTAYCHALLPKCLPHRINTSMYQFDPPISRNGETAAIIKGRQLANENIHVDYCFASPASRCVITANAILYGMGQQSVPICIENYLMEPMSCSTSLQLLGSLSPFLELGDWMRSGYNIDRNYRTLNPLLPKYDTEHYYYYRSKLCLERIVRTYYSHQAINTNGARSQQRITILIVGHACTTPIFEMVAIHTGLNVNELIRKTEEKQYLDTAILEYDNKTKRWRASSALS